MDNLDIVPGLNRGITLTASVRNWHIDGVKSRLTLYATMHMYNQL